MEDKFVTTTEKGQNRDRQELKGKQKKTYRDRQELKKDIQKVLKH